MRIHVDVDLCRGCEACELVCSLIHEGESNPQLARVQVQKDMATYIYKISLYYGGETGTSFPIAL